MQCVHLHHHNRGPYSSSDWLFLKSNNHLEVFSALNDYCLALMIYLCSNE